ncbi:hypothetical protein [Streptomyces sp. VB1]|uniref:hypothetical protein n=1 Tax=Streptomyces sp. VB1 TaxID=2986803 RepID=UPI002241D958|nr:hypothetical protein [Streptomyces sp. VB1]UZI29532.1 hypothetical protein OH133_16085 [Streptomyces sp. VB1]
MQTPPPDAGLRVLLVDDGPTVAGAVAGHPGRAVDEVPRADGGPAAPACAARHRSGRPGHSTTTEG